jgi:DNA-directed RNA polymerase
MYWLTTSARVISKSVPGDRVLEAMEPNVKRKKGTKKVDSTRWRKEQMTAVVWTTPLGLPIVQPYRKVKRKQVMASMQSVFISDPNAPAEGEQRHLGITVDEVLMFFFFLQSTRQSRRRLSRLILFIA